MGRLTILFFIHFNFISDGEFNFRFLESFLVITCTIGYVIITMIIVL